MVYQSKSLNLFLLSVLEKSEWIAFFHQTVPSLLPICEAFPPLCDEATALLVQVGRVCYTHMTVSGNPAKTSKYILNCFFFLTIRLKYLFAY